MRRGHGTSNKAPQQLIDGCASQFPPVSYRHFSTQKSRKGGQELQMSRIISRWRNKDKNGASNSSSILPSTFSADHPSSPSSPSTLSNPPSYGYNYDAYRSSSSSSRSYPRSHNVPGHIRPVTCTNFLMGGQYYPGKDKKRNVLRRKTLWYRIFCSTRMRVVGSCAILAYLVVMFLLVPAVDVIYEYGDILARRKTPPIPLPSSLKNKYMSKKKDIMNKKKANVVVHKDDDDEVGPKSSPVEAGKDEEEDTDDHDFEQEENDVGGVGELGDESENKAEEEKRKTEEKIKQMLDARRQGKPAETADIGEKKGAMEPEQVPKMGIKSLDILKEDVKRMNEKLSQIDKDPTVKKEKDDVLKNIAPEFHDAATKARNYDGGDGINANDKSKEKQENESNGVDNQNNGEAVTDPKEKTPVVAKKRTLLNRKDHHKFSSCPKRGVEKVSITLITQTTFDRLDILQLTCQRWTSSPLVVTVYLTQDEYDTRWNSSQSELMKVCNVDTVLIPHISESNEERALKYPINTLRNKALDRVTSSHVFITDIDMIPSNGLDSDILNSIDLAIERRLDDDGDNQLDPVSCTLFIPATFDSISFFSYVF